MAPADTPSPKGREGDAAAAPATFHGRLALQDFMYSPSKDSELPRRSPRQTSLARTGITGNMGGARGDAATARLGGPLKNNSPGKRAPKRRKTSASTETSPAPATEATEAGSGPGTKPKIETSASSPPRKRNTARPRAGYAPPSTYAHLPLLPDALAPSLIVLFVGLNPGLSTARTGHAYAHPSNLFWKLLASSGATPRLCRPDEDRRLPALYSLGLTNIVARPSRNGAELSRREMDGGVATLEDKARRWRPEAVCVVGKGIWESIWRVRHGEGVGRGFRYGWQDEGENMGVVRDGDDNDGGHGGGWPGARVFVATSTSGLAASLSPREKEAIWAELGAFVKARRAERAAGHVGESTQRSAQHSAQEFAQEFAQESVQEPAGEPSGEPAGEPAQVSA